jgi:2,3-bisphosphoglycerate-dependent phosphoglycerate mutase
MQKKSLILILSLIVFLGYIAPALGDAGDEASLTTLILVRHAEKAADGTLDPPLTQEGEARAAELAYLLGHMKLDAVYATPFKRTHDTVLPTASAKRLEVASYRADQDDFLDMVLKEHRGGTVLICGHSNTVPALANKLLGRKKYAQLDDAVYDNLFIVSVPASGPARVLRLRFGDHTPIQPPSPSPY